jgi:hypothetical protein
MTFMAFDDTSAIAARYDTIGLNATPRHHNPFC